jgi:hypothetical protein
LKELAEERKEGEKRKAKDEREMMGGYMPGPTWRPAMRGSLGDGVCASPCTVSTHVDGEDRQRGWAPGSPRKPARWYRSLQRTNQMERRKRGNIGYVRLGWTWWYSWAASLQAVMGDE